MDKYTVDLDKVLNDFEYSELTDQYSVDTAASHYNNLNTSLQRLKNNTPVKHTINNVFQSLNEYLNSDISGSNINSTVSIKTYVPPLNDNESNCLNSHVEVGENQENIDPAFVADTINLESDSEATAHNVELPVVDANQSILVPIELDLISGAVNHNTEIPQFDTNEIQDDCEKIGCLVQTNLDIVENTVSGLQAIENDIVALRIVDELPNVVETSDIQLEPLTETSTFVNEEVVTIQSLPCLETVSETITQLQVDDSKSDEQVPKIIGFDESIGIDDDELHLYLDALESELDITEDSNAPETETIRPNTLHINQQIDLIGEPGSTPYNNMYTSSSDAGKLHAPDSETSPSASPTFSDVSSGSSVSTATIESVTDSIVETTIDVAAPPAEPVENQKEDEQQSNSPDPPMQSNTDYSWLGKQAPLWIPDSEALNCLHCDIKFTVIKRRHHCRACGLVLCSKCCNMKFKLEYLDAESRVCLKCYDKLIAALQDSPPDNSANQPNPNNPMEYCSTVPPLQQVGNENQNPPTVMVPVGVLKRTGSSKSRTNKSVMFCDGIRPGSELTNLDNDFNYNQTKKKGPSPPPIIKPHRNMPVLDVTTKSFIPSEDNMLPPTVNIFKSDITYTECTNTESTVETLKNEQLSFAIQNNLYVNVRIINMDCCINKWAWCFSTQGMIAVGQDEIVLLLELCDSDQVVPKDIFVHLNHIYTEAKKGSSISESGISLHPTPNFLGSKNHMGFLYIRPTFQCLQNVIVPKEPYLIGILIHRWEMPWAKIFPLRLVLRLGAAYRYYPSPIISVRNRESVYVEIGHTIINLLADFRNYSYTLPNIRGLTIHMEGKSTTVTIPKNRYDQVMKSLNTSSDQTLAFGGNFSTDADSHLVCVQDVDGNNENAYTTHSISIQNRPRKVTGVNFIVFNGSLKPSSGLTAKSSLVEDGLMIQILPEQMIQIHEGLRNMKDYTIMCGCVNATSDESVNIVWGDSDVSFNQGIVSSIDNQSLSGVPSIRVHNGKDYISNSGNRMIRWTEVFIIQNGDDNARAQEIDFSKLSENIAKASCQALVKYLDLLTSNNFYKIGIRSVLHIENVSYSAGSNGTKLPPIYMKSLDNELIQVLHRITSNNSLGEKPIILELIFHILNV